jgi:hypothetical protein
MAKAFGFTHDELKLLLVAVRQMRRTFEKARKAGAAAAAPIDDYARLYDDLFEKLLDMVGPMPEHVEDVLEL